MQKIVATGAWSITALGRDDGPLESIRLGQSGGGDLGVHAFNFKQGDPPYLLKADVQTGASFLFPDRPKSAKLIIRTRGNGRNYGPGAPVDMIVERVTSPGHSVDVPGSLIARAAIPHGSRLLETDLDVSLLDAGENILRVRADMDQVLRGERTFAQFASWQLPAEIEFEVAQEDTVQEVSDFWADSLQIPRDKADAYREIMTPVIIDAAAEGGES